MTSHALHHYPASTELPRWLIVGFVSGFLSVLLVHQGAFALRALSFGVRLGASTPRQRTS